MSSNRSNPNRAAWLKAQSEYRKARRSAADLRAGFDRAQRQVSIIGPAEKFGFYVVPDVSSIQIAPAPSKGPMSKGMFGDLERVLYEALVNDLSRGRPDRPGAVGMVLDDRGARLLGDINRGDEIERLRRELEEAQRNARDAVSLAESYKADADRSYAYVDRLNAQPHNYMTVLGAGSKPGKWLVRRGAETLEVTAGDEKLDIKPGATVRVLTQTMNIRDVVEAPPMGGEIVKVASVTKDGALAEITYGAGTRAIMTAGHAVTPGDRVILDPANVAIVRNLGKEEPPQAVGDESPTVEWGDVGGQSAAKAALREAIEGPVLRREIYARYGRRPTKGVLLFGPPGNGKTMLGKAAATALARLHGASASSSGFLYVKGPELLSMWVGAAERGVRELFDAARAHKAKHGYPAVIFIDEAEALLSKRGGSAGVGGTTIGAAEVASTLVPAFLAEMDGMFDSGAVVLLATNRPDVLDPAIVREGRIDRKVFVGRPSKTDATEIFRRYFAARPVATIDAAQTAADELFSTARALYKVTLSSGRTKYVTLGDVTSGAQIAGIVDAAATFAIDRELSGDDEAPGINGEDIFEAVERTFSEQRHVNHADEIAAFCEPFAAQVTNVERVRGAVPTGEKESLITTDARAAISRKELGAFVVSPGGDA